jgi:hypothetical protein
VRYLADNNSAGTNNATSGTEFTVWGAMEATAGAGTSGFIRMHNPLGAHAYKFFPFQGAAHQDNGLLYAYDGAMFFAGTSAINALRFKASTGNMSTGTIRIYGIAKS